MEMKETSATCSEMSELLGTVSSGCNQTDARVFPQEWASHSISELAARHSNAIVGGPFGSDLVSKDYVSVGVPVIRGQNMFGHYVAGDFVFVSKTKARRLQANLARPNDIVFTQRGTLGQVALVPIAPFNEYVISQSQMKLTLKPDTASAEYIYQYFMSDAGQKQILESAIQTGVPHTNLSILRRYQVPVPPTKAEQEAIAEALSDADALIESLEQLIAKKRQIKQGTMQALLTGKQRLPGFGGNWQKRLLGEIAHIKTGNRNNQDKIDDGLYPFFVRSETVERINSFSHECEAILIPGEGRIGEIFHYINGRFAVHQRVYAVTQFASGVLGRYVHLYMAVHFGVHAMENSVKATVDSLRLPTFQVFEVNLPPTIEEQSVIVAILTDMDAELAELEGRLAKTRKLKQGMMQELLTGRIRLV